jgi:hypothetical protein
MSQTSTIEIGEALREPDGGEASTETITLVRLVESWTGYLMHWCTRAGLPAEAAVVYQLRSKSPKRRSHKESTPDDVPTTIHVRPGSTHRQVMGP